MSTCGHYACSNPRLEVRRTKSGKPRFSWWCRDHQSTGKDAWQCEWPGCERAGFGTSKACADHQLGRRRPASAGYVDICTEDGWMPEHRVVMAAAIGRPLLPWENVHHRNGERADNRLSNLELWAVPQPAGQRSLDLLAWAREIVALYEPIEGILGAPTLLPLVAAPSMPTWAFAP